MDIDDIRKTQNKKWLNNEYDFPIIQPPEEGILVQPGASGVVFTPYHLKPEPITFWTRVKKIASRLNPGNYIHKDDLDYWDY